MMDSIITIESKTLAKRLKRKLGHEPPFLRDEISKIEVLALWDDSESEFLEFALGLEDLRFIEWTYSQQLPDLDFLKKLEDVKVLRSPVTSIDSLKKVPGLRKLVLQRSDISDLSPLRACPLLQVLELENCPVQDIAVLRECKALRRVSIINCLVDDLTPLFELLQTSPELKIKISGNPLNEESEAKLISIESRHIRFENKNTLPISRLLRKTGHPLVAWIVDEDGCSVSYVGAQPKWLGFWEPDVPVEILLEVLAEREDWPLKALRDRVMERREAYLASLPPEPPQPPPFRYDDHIEEGDAASARTWIKESELSEEEKAVFLDFIERFPDGTFNRLDEEYLDKHSEYYGCAPPPWLRKIMLTFWSPRGGRLVHREVHPEMNFGFSEEQRAFSLWVGPGNDQSAYIEAGWFNIAEARNLWCVGVDMNNPEDRRVRMAYIYDDAKTPISVQPVAFDDYLDIFRKAYALGDYVDNTWTLTKELHPPKV